MSIFAKKKEEIFSLPEKYNTSFIQGLSNKMLNIKIGAKLCVPSDRWAVIVVKDKPRDVIESGEWIISLDRIPNTVKVLKLDKPTVVSKKGGTQKVYKEEFRCDLYFVNKNVVSAQEWFTDTLYKRTKDKKKYSVTLSGQCDFRCVDPVKMIKLFLYEWAAFESEKCKKFVREYIGALVYEILGEKNLTPKDIDVVENCISMIMPKLSKELAKYGLEVLNFSIHKTQFDVETAAELVQDKMDTQFDSDEINELGAEISIKDTKATKESSRSVIKLEQKNEVLDMREENLIKKDSDIELPKINLTKKNTDNK